MLAALLSNHSKINISTKMHMKILIASALFAVVATKPQPILGPLLTNLISHQDSPRSIQTQPTDPENGNSNGNNLLSVYANLALGINPKLQASISLLNGVSQHNKPGTLNDVIDVIFQVSWGLTDVLDNRYPGTGSILRRLVQLILRVVFCTPLLRHNNSFGICRRNYGSDLGCRTYNGRFDILNLISFYNGRDARDEVDQLINQYSNGKGINSLNGTESVLFLQLSLLSDLSHRRTSDWSSQDFLSLFDTVAIYSGALGNVRRQGLGLDIVQGLIDFSHPSCSLLNLDINALFGGIKIKLGHCDRNNFNHGITTDDNSDDSDDSDDQGDSDNDDNGDQVGSGDQESDNSGSSSDNIDSPQSSNDSCDNPQSSNNSSDSPQSSNNSNDSPQNSNNSSDSPQSSNDNSDCSKTSSDSSDGSLINIDIDALGK